MEYTEEDRVKVKYDGVMYKGTIERFNKDGTYTVSIIAKAFANDYGTSICYVNVKEKDLEEIR